MVVMVIEWWSWLAIIVTAMTSYLFSFSLMRQTQHGGAGIARLVGGSISDGTWELGPLQRSANVEHAQLMWNKGGAALLALFRSEMDTTGRSYHVGDVVGVVCLFGVFFD